MAKKQEEKQVNAPAAKTDGPQETGALTSAAFNTSLAKGAPEWLTKKMEGKAPRGLEAGDQEDFIYPRLVLCQSLTPFVTDGKRRVGDICDNITGELICESGQKVLFVPVILSKARMFMVPFEEGGGIKCRAFDAMTAQPGGCGQNQGGEPTRNCDECVHKEWDDSKAAGAGAPACTLFYNVLGFLPEYGNRTIVFSAKATAVKVMRRFLSLGKNTGADFWAHLFELFAVDEQSATFKYKNWGFEPKGWVTQEQYAFGEKIYNTLSGEKWSVNTKDLETPPPAGSSVAGNPPPAAADAPF